jgi:frataxin-like iron-binding protein CyaY
MVVVVHCRQSQSNIQMIWVTFCANGSHFKEINAWENMKSSEYLEYLDLSDEVCRPGKIDYFWFV